MIKDKVLNNSLFLTGAAVINRLLKFMLIPIATAKLGPELFGAYNYALSLVMIFFMFSDLGTGGLFLKEYPRKKDDSVYISTLFSLRVVLLFTLGIVSMSLYIWVKDPLIRSIYF